MLANRAASRGVTLIEIAITLVILAILLAYGAPNFATWIANTRIRTAAESVQNGLQLARAEAVRRNGLVGFRLTTSTDNGCGLSTAGPNWVVSMDDPSAACGATASDTAAPRIIQVRPATEGSAGVTLAAGQAAIAFNGWGRVTPVPVGDVNIDVQNPGGGSCAPAGAMRCLRVVVSPGGQVRMCDPVLPSTDPQGC